MNKESKACKGLYHIRLLRNYVEYLQKHYPQLDLDELLNYAGLTKSQLDDPGYWCTQEQTDNFHKILDEKTHHPNISREVGRYSSISATYGTVRQYIFGFFKLSTAYSMVQKICAKLSRGMTYSIRMVGPNSMEALSVPNPGVKEKQYQCENRIGMLEALAMPFTGKYAEVEHPECIHKGGACCMYKVSWHEPLSLKLKHILNIYTIFSVVIFASFLPLFRHELITALLFLMNMIIILSIKLYSNIPEKNEINERIQNQSQAAELLMDESNKRYNEAQLVHEIGQAISKIIDVDDLLATVMSLIEEHLEFKRGMVLLANEDNTRLVYRAGYGYSSEQIKIMKGIQLHLDKDESRGPFILAYKKQIPYLIKDVDEILHDLSERTRSLVETLGPSSFICIPIVYENQSMGVLSVDSTKSQGSPKQSDLNLLMGIAPQIAISINNARTFEKMQSSEEKYRVLVESANSIILRINTQGHITFANRFAQEFYGYSEHEMLGKEIVGLIMPGSDSKGRDLSRFVHDFLNNPEDYVTTVSECVQRSGERVWVSWSNKAIRNKDGTIIEVPLCRQ